jgi:hypothetical protein
MRVTVVTEVKVRNGETAGKVGMRMGWSGQGCSHGLKEWAQRVKGEGNRVGRGRVEQ